MRNPTGLNTNTGGGGLFGQSQAISIPTPPINGPPTTVAPVQLSGGSSGNLFGGGGSTRPSSGLFSAPRSPTTFNRNWYTPNGGVFTSETAAAQEVPSAPSSEQVLTGSSQGGSSLTSIPVTPTVVTPVAPAAAGPRPAARTLSDSTPRSFGGLMSTFGGGNRFGSD